MGNAVLEQQKQSSQSLQLSQHKEQQGSLQQSFTGEEQSLFRDQETEQINVTGIFAEIFQEDTVSQDAFHQEPGESFEQQAENQRLSAMQKRKRSAIAAEKLGVQMSLKNGKTTWIARENMDRDTFDRKIREHFGEDGDEVLEKMPEEMESLYEWFSSDAGMQKAVQDKEITSLGGASVAVFRKIADLDPADFAASSDKEFAAGYAQKYQVIRRIAETRSLYETYLEKGGSPEAIGEGVDLAQKIESFDQLKTEYEARMKMISSPYYALLSDRDLAQADDNDLPSDDPAFSEYLGLYRKLSQKQ